MCLPLLGCNVGFCCGGEIIRKLDTDGEQKKGSTCIASLSSGWERPLGYPNSFLSLFFFSDTLRHCLCCLRLSWLAAYRLAFAGLLPLILSPLGDPGLGCRRLACLVFGCLCCRFLLADAWLAVCLGAVCSGVAVFPVVDSRLLQGLLLYFSTVKGLSSLAQVWVVGCCVCVCVRECTRTRVLV